MKYTC